MDNLNEAKIQKAIFDHFADRAIVLPNVYFRRSKWEMDALVVSKTGLTTEFEIKCTRADWKAEVKNKRLKHKYMTMTSAYSCYYHANYYNVICPSDLLTPDDITVLNPDYGLYYCDSLVIWPIKRGKKLHDKQVDHDDYVKFFKKLMYKLFNHSDKNRVRHSQ